MKKILFFLTVAVLLIGCRNDIKNYPSKEAPIKGVDSTDLIAVEMEQCGTSLSREEYLDSCLKDWPFPGANGNWIPSREGIENSDTVVNGYPYNHI